VAEKEIIAQADRNRARMRVTDAAERRRMLTELQTMLADRAKARDYLLRTSMITGLRSAAQVE
jgi:3-(3-hydroxy-phenyl)propionate hydroxylase